MLPSYLGLGELVGNGEDTGNILADSSDSDELGSGTAVDLRDAEGLELVLELLDLGHKLLLGLDSKLVCSYLSHF